MVFEAPKQTDEWQTFSGTREAHAMNSALWSSVLGVPVERSEIQYTGQIYVRAAQDPDSPDGYQVHIYLPIANSEGLHIRCSAELPAGWSQRIRAIVAAHNDPQVSGMDEPPGWLLPSGHYFPTSWQYPAAREVGDLGSTLGGLIGGIGGAIAGGPGGAAAGAAGGSALGSLIQSVADGGAPAARPGNLPPQGSAANRLRILQFLGVTPGMDAQTVAAKLREGSTRAWAPEDIADATAMIPAASSMSGPIPSLEAIVNATGAASGGGAGASLPSPATPLPSELPSVVSQGAQTALASLLGNTANGSTVAPLLVALQALQRGTALASSPLGGNALGALTPDVLNLMGDSLSQVSAIARALTGDPTALAVVDNAVQRASQRQANAIQLVRAMLGAFQQ